MTSTPGGKDGLIKNCVVRRNNLKQGNGAGQGITIETPSQTEILIKGIDRQQVGQVAAVIRGYRPPDAYKGKGVRYSNEVIVLKEAKKK